MTACVNWIAVVATAISWRLVIAVIAVLVIAALVRSMSRRPGRVLVVRVLAGAPTGMRIEIEGSIAGRSEDAVRDFVGALDLPPGAALWVLPDRGKLSVRANHLVPEHLRDRFAAFILGT